jgi:hypothetical protein
MAHTVNVYFSRMTPESAEDGDFSKTGVVNEDVSLEPDKWPGKESETPVELAVKLLRYDGATEPSSTHFHKGVWYSTQWEVVSYRTSEEEEKTFHLKGFSEAEEREVYNEITRRR